MRVLIAPDCFTGTLSAPEAAAAIAEGWRRQAPTDALELCPLSDGGPGFLDVLHAALGGRLVALTVPGPLGHPTPAGLLLAPDGTAYLESAQACGLHLVPQAERDPGRTTTAGVGRLLLAARAAGARRVVVGLGGSATNDAGAGALLALAEAAGLDIDPAKLGRGGAGLAGVSAADLKAVTELRRDWEGIELLVAADVDGPLLGAHGASLGFAPQKGANRDQAAQLEAALMDFAAAAIEATGVPQRMVATPGTGAAGGLGFGLLVLGGHRVAGAEAVTDAVGFPERLARNDVVVTGEGRFDWQSLRGKVVAGVAHAAMQIGTPVVVIAGQVEVGRREALSIGVEAAYPVARNPAEVAAAIADPAGTLAARAERVARTWSR